MGTQPTQPAAATTAPQPQPEAQQPQPEPQIKQQRQTMSELLEAAIAKTDTEQQERWGRIRAIGASAAASGCFPDLDSESKATMRLLAGEALGLTEFVALKECRFIKGNLSMSYTLIGSLIRRAGYTWGFIQHDEAGCALAFFKGFDENGKPRPFIDYQTGKQIIVRWMKADADRADLSGPRGQGKEKGMYEKYPLNMYLAGCLRNFPRYYAPEVTNGISVYTPDEFGVAVDSSGNPTEQVEQPSMPRRKTAEPEAEVK